MSATILSFYFGILRDIYCTLLPGKAKELCTDLPEIHNVLNHRLSALAAPKGFVHFSNATKDPAQNEWESAFSQIV